MVILDEKKYVEEILVSGEVGSKPSYTIALLTRYYYHCKGVTNESELENIINNFMTSNCVEFNAVKWENVVTKYIKQAKKYSLHRIDGVNIYQSELDIISELETEKDRQVLFAMMCYVKFYNAMNPDKNNNWCNTSEREFFASARVTVKSKRDRMDKMKSIMNYLNNTDGNNSNNPDKIERIVLTNKIDKVNFRLPFVVNENDTDQTPVFKVSDFRELGYEYLSQCSDIVFGRCQHEGCGILFKQNKLCTKKYCSVHKGYQLIGTKVITCVDCGKKVEIDGIVKKQERCPECAKVRRKEKDKERKRKNKSSSTTKTK